MSVFDIKQMAQGLYIPEEKFPHAREVIARRMVEVAVEFINDPEKGQESVDHLVGVYEIDYGMNQVERQISDVICMVQAETKKWHWDPRIKVKLEDRSIGRHHVQLKVSMDLEATLQSMINGVEVIEEREHVEDAVLDNPGSELLNALDGFVSKRSERRVPLLSDRYARTVKDSSRRG